MDLNFSWDFSTPEIYCLGALILIWIIEIIYQFYLFNRPFRVYQKEKNGKIEYTHPYPAVSVIVYAQNDAENLVKYLPKILNQAYPEFEVIVVNDDSTDDSKDILSVLETQYKNLYHTYVPEGSRNLSHKKLALTLGIKAGPIRYSRIHERQLRSKKQRMVGRYRPKLRSRNRYCFRLYGHRTKGKRKTLFLVLLL